ncbi:peroxisomal N(1)-acetyl-spermine/spermidine oxidase-like isoform X1 [Amphibalanus amphitrite]|nr:peroxisomal N(1)-acetyl-spermine/spermidine oxidase-like isoform X1 [Amphibalanus amphitrite]XP_043225186.1 peroxisomal N(1)-acetyl-spermine/spermidine oxidase-like isoform X1 [Amphibalanus amphitrite]XP_043225187.1 peroxisomal N(1)-acetyl-spermine/spermidine oxidase-like isoform X1 [Amphibalanus amphitrite]
MAAAMADTELSSAEGAGPAGQQPGQSSDPTPDQERAGQEKPSNPDEGPVEHHQVLIIGGGVSGLSAASCLVKNGITDFRLLEARGRLGGRVVGITVDQLKLQLGAMWIHGVLGNPIYELAVRSGLIKSIQDQPVHSLMACREDGRPIPFHIVQEVYDAYEQFMDRCVEYFLCKYEPPDGVRSVGEHIRLEVDLYLAGLPERERDVRRLLFEYLLKREAVIAGAHSMDEVDLLECGTYCDLPGGNILLPEGYSSILGPLRQDVPPETLLLGHPVSQVSWAARPDRVTVTCESGRRLSAEHVVCTVPLGVLKERAERLFEPPLPAARTAAIQRLGFGTANKIFLEYDRPFLPANVTELLLAWGPTDPSQPVAQRWQRKIYSFSKMSETLLLAWVVGEEAVHMETLPMDEVGRVCTEVLATFLDDPCVPRPKRTVCSGWKSQPYSRGSYSFIKTGSTQADIYTVGSPILAEDGKTPRLLFAGEHCHPSFYSTVHGAYLTGRSAVQQILSATAAADDGRPAAAADEPPTLHQPDEDATDLSAWLAGIDLT